MTPTNELRWVERIETTIVEAHENYTIGSKVVKPVLQQKWIGREYMGEVEWRDVPTEKEA